MVNDRGSIKWSSLMLPEHVEQLKELLDKEKIEQEPILSEDAMEELNYQLFEAINQYKEVQITIYHNNYLQTKVGVVTALSVHNATIQFEEKNTDSSMLFLIKQIKRLHVMD
ncbi:YolD-like family protein [Saliterribacillus persicus]|uniref:YolD-like protein n=1 Tax=Saliterribacillus persicus TaxID=930114 RepID=A0A368XD77_9BACI|nr:YolD-like family protein [Saliterribacillus persicus]RCW64968.1 YolD-like protein [Saliterribacillus persicus]